MAEERDPKISAAYRELGAEEPPRALDEAILAAARRSPGFSIGPWTHRWAVPLSLAAVVVLSVTVTLQMQREQPDSVSPVPQAQKEIAAAKPAQAPESLLKPGAQEQVKAVAGAPARERSAKPALRSEPKPFADALRDQAPAAAAPAPEVSSRADTARGELSSATGAAAPRAAPVTPQAAPAQALAKRAMAREEVRLETPERELDRIAQLRRDGRHEEAAKALAEFRKRYPDFMISEAMLERVERR